MACPICLGHGFGRAPIVVIAVAVFAFVDVDVFCILSELICLAFIAFQESQQLGLLKNAPTAVSPSLCVDGGGCGWVLVMWVGR